MLPVSSTSPQKTPNMPYPVYSSQTQNNGLMGYYKDYLFDTAITWTTDGANAGTVNYRGEKFYSTNVNGVLLSDLGYANKCIAEALNKIAWKHVSHVGNPKLMNNVMSEIELVIPPTIHEQQSISNIFTKIDDIITLHQRKYDKLINVKKALLDKMFPKNGELTPKIRFKGFTDTWEQCELCELAQITMGQSPNGINYTSNPEDYILVQGNADMENGWVTPRVWTTQITKMAEPNDLIFSVRAPVGAVGKTKYKAVIGRGVASIRGNEFVFQGLLRLNMNNHWKTISTGSTFDSINSTELNRTSIKAPKIEEQNKIGGFLKSVDTLITLHQHKLERLEELKKGYMQRLFA